MNIKGMAFLCAFAASAAFAEEVVDTTDGITIDIPSGEEVTRSEKFTGSGKITKTGAGKLILDNPNNDWTGGIKIDAGSLTAAATGCLGSGTVTVGGTSAATLYFQQKATDENAFTFANAITYGRSSSRVQFKSDTTTTGTINGAGNDPYLGADEGVTVTCKGALTAYSNRSFIFDQLKGTVIFEDAVTTMTSLTEWQQNGNNNGGRVCLANTGNAPHICIASIKYECQAAGVLPASKEIRRNRYSSSYGGLDLNGFDQTVSAVDVCGQSALGSSSTAENISTPDGKPATLTFRNTATSSAKVCDFALNGPLSLVIDCESTSTQTFINRTNGMTGDITVSSGTFKMTGTSSFPGVRKLTVAADAKALVESTATQVFSDALELDLSEGSELALNGTQVSVSKLTYKGVELPVGYYSSDLCPAITSGSVRVVPLGTDTVVWTGEGADTKFSTMGNWSADSIDFSRNGLAATFAAGGTEAAVDTNVLFSALTLSAPTFAFTDAGGLMTFSMAQLVFGDATGNRMYEFAAPTVVDGNLSITSPADTTIMLSHDIVAPVGTNPGTITYDGSASGAYLYLNGVSIDHGVSVRGPAGVAAFRTQAGTTNAIGGTLTIADASTQNLLMGTDASLTVRGDVLANNGFWLQGRGAMIVDGRVRCNAKKVVTVNCESSGNPSKLALVLNGSGGTGATLCVAEYGGRIEFGTDNTFSSNGQTSGTKFSVRARWNGAAKVRMNATTQTFASFSVIKSGSGTVEVLASSGSVLRAVGTDDSSFYGSSAGERVVLTGDLELENAGSGALTVGNLDIDGTLSVRLSGENGKLKVLDGSRIKLEHLWVGEEEIPAGTYTYASAPAALRARLVESTGKVHVGHPGAVLIVR